MNIFWSICMHQREWKGGEWKMRKYEMRHKVTEKAPVREERSRQGKDCLADEQRLCVQHGGNFQTLSFYLLTSIGLL